MIGNVCEWYFVCIIRGGECVEIWECRLVCCVYRATNSTRILCANLIEFLRTHCIVSINWCFDMVQCYGHWYTFSIYKRDITYKIHIYVQIVSICWWFQVFFFPLSRRYLLTYKYTGWYSYIKLLGAISSLIQWNLAIKNLLHFKKYL